MSWGVSESLAVASGIGVRDWDGDGLHSGCSEDCQMTIIGPLSTPQPCRANKLIEKWNASSSPWPPHSPLTSEARLFTSPSNVQFQCLHYFRCLLWSASANIIVVIIIRVVGLVSWTSYESDTVTVGQINISWFCKWDHFLLFEVQNRGFLFNYGLTSS